ncbi:hypothetical protein [Bifidobacterium choloepi]|uniref:hypothetical protein n=1 Tax=Bifidobacterium choloepi TaxID=2614131 RepID=UPI0018C8773F|nr:hypothetical protein [Bifidobacterium choloepi]
MCNCNPCNCGDNCACDDNSNANYLHCSTGKQSYANPSFGPYIASEHVPGEFGPVYVA